jgi:hypothetical protein
MGRAALRRPPCPDVQRGGTGLQATDVSRPCRAGGPKAGDEAEKVRSRLLHQVTRKRNPRTRANVGQLLYRSLRRRPVARRRGGRNGSPKGWRCAGLSATFHDASSRPPSLPPHARGRPSGPSASARPAGWTRSPSGGGTSPRLYRVGDVDRDQLDWPVLRVQDDPWDLLRIRLRSCSCGESGPAMRGSEEVRQRAVKPPSTVISAPVTPYGFLTGKDFQTPRYGSGRVAGNWGQGVASSNLTSPTSVCPCRGHSARSDRGPYQLFMALLCVD